MGALPTIKQNYLMLSLSKHEVGNTSILRQAQDEVLRKRWENFPP
jgi:hypothetical protein